MKKITLFILFNLALSISSYSQSPCDYSVTLNDSYGDGWNGASINILVNNVEVLEAITIANGYDATFSIPNVADGAVITSEIVSVGPYPNEITWDIKNNIGTIVDSGDGSPQINVNIAVACQSAIVPPTNISSSSAIPINCGETLTTNSLGSTATPEDVGCTMSDSGVWYKFDGTGLDVTVTVTAPYDQELAIASGTPGALVNVDCVDNGFTSETATLATTLGTTYYIYTAHYGSSGSTGEISVNLECATCSPATATVNVVNDCDASGGFLIDLEVTSLGSATSLEVSDGTTTQTVTAAGTTQFGPYTNGTLVDISLTPNDDSSCALSVTGLTQAGCPPVNDTCSNATPYTDSFTMYAEGECATTPTPPNTLDFTFATDDAAGDTPSCDGFGNFGVWYTWTASSTGLSFTSDTGLPGIAVYETGTCGSLVQVGCLNNTSGDITGLTLSNNYIIHIWDDTPDVVEFCLEEFTPPPPPANDSCSSATVVDTLHFTSSADASAATNNDGSVTSCGFGMNDGVWYTFTPTVSGTLDLSVDVTGWDHEISVYTGSCGVFTCVDSADNAGSSSTESLSISVTAGTQYWLNIAHFSSTDNSEGAYTFNATSSNGVSLGLDDMEISQFTYYPNPVNNTLTLDAQKNIESVVAYNMLGQEVLRLSPNVANTEVDMSSLISGAYFVKVSIQGATKTVRVVKQ